MGEQTVAFIGPWVTIYWVLYAITNLGCAYFVYQDAMKQSRHALNIGAGWWALFCIIGGVWPLLVYWVMQHSSLSNRVE